jgi:exodeoxyribonuclease VII small subunit
MKENKKSFEEAISQLEEVVSKLEKGEQSLDDSIDIFQKGIELSKYCNRKLDEVEKKISILIEEENGELKEKNFSGLED